MMEMDKNAVLLFVLEAEMLNISAAGLRLGLAPAVASARLAKLEQQVGADLLHRSTRKVSLSLEGAELLPFAKGILAQEDATLAALGHRSSDVTGRLRFAASSAFVQLYVTPVLPEFLARHPSVTLEMALSDGPVLLIKGGFGPALRNFAIEDNNLRARKLADDMRVLCASREYLKPYGAPRHPDDLGDCRILAFRDSKTRRVVASGKQPPGVFPPPNGEICLFCDDGASMRIATEAGVGVSTNSLWSVHRAFEGGSLTRVLPDYETEDQAAIRLVYPGSNVLTAKVRVFKDFLLEKSGTSPIWARPKQ